MGGGGGKGDNSATQHPYPGIHKLCTLSFGEEETSSGLAKHAPDRKFEKSAQEVA